MGPLRFRLPLTYILLGTVLICKYLLTSRNGSLYFFLSDVGGNTLSHFTFYLLHDFLRPYLYRVWPSLCWQGSVAFPRHYFNRTLFLSSNFLPEHLKDVERHSKTLDEVEPGPTELTSVACLVVRVNRSFHLFLCIYWCLGWRWGQTGDLESTIMYTIHPEEKTATEKTIGF